MQKHLSREACKDRAIPHIDEGSQCQCKSPSPCVSVAVCLSCLPMSQETVSLSVNLRSGPVLRDVLSNHQMAFPVFPSHSLCIKPLRSTIIFSFLPVSRPLHRMGYGTRLCRCLKKEKKKNYCSPHLKASASAESRTSTSR